MLNRIRVLGRRIRGLFSRRRLDEEFQQELDSHLEMLTEENLRRGMSSEEARRMARVQLGGVTQLREIHREQWTFPFLETLLQDLRYGLRQLRRNPGFTTVAVVTLALGIGANTAIFSVAYAVLVNPYPYRGADRMVNFSIVGKKKSDETNWYSFDEFRAIRDENKVFDGVIAYSAHNWVLSGGKVPEVVFVTEMTGNAFRYFGVSPLLGRVFTTADAPPGKSPAPVAALSFRFWKEHFASERDVIGKTIRLNGRPYTVIGVLPRRFTWHNAEVYIPTDRSWKYVWIGARLRPGITLSRARADTRLIFGQFEKLHPHAFPPDGFTVKVERLDNWALGSFRDNLFMLLLAVGLLLLIACSNVASLHLAKGSSRQAEIAVRTSIGASRGRVIRQLLTESVLLSLSGGVFGVLLAYAGVRLIAWSMPPNAIPHETILGVSFQALLFALVISLFVGILSGLAPALEMAKVNLAESLTRGGRGGAEGVSRRRIRKVLVVSQYTIGLILLVSAGLALRSFLALRAVRLGFDPSHVMTMEIPIHWGSTGWKKRVTDLNGILSRVKSLPGVEASALSISTQPPPLQASLHTSVYSGGASAEDTHPVEMNLVSPGFFHTFHVPLVRGRIFTNSEVLEGRQVVVVSQSTARLFWPSNENPIGRRIHLSLEAWQIQGIAWPPNLNGWCEVVGVVKDVHNQGLERPPQPAFYIPYTLLVPSEATLSLRTSSNPLLLANGVRAVVASQMNGQPVTSVWRLSDYLTAFSLSHDRFSAVLFLLFGLLGLALCATGIYGVVSYAVSRRTHEIGIRVALGAQKQQVLWMVIRETMGLALVGVGLGLAAASSVTRLFASQLFGISPHDPLTLVLVSLILIAVAFAACCIPARRAARIDPMVALRYE